MIDIENFIAGKFSPSQSMEWIDDLNPATEEIFARVTNSDARDVEQAVEAAHKAFPEWRALTMEVRSELLLKLAELILENIDELARAETIDNGKPIKVSRTVDIPRAAYNFSFFAEHAKDFKSLRFDAKDMHSRVYHEALGAVAVISPWNLPLYLLTWKIAPALIVGNTVVAKPSEFTPYTAYLLCKLIKKAGIPDGVVNVIHGQGPRFGEALCTHPHIKAVSFTGSTATGRMINQYCAPHFKKVSLEMGGKNAAIIYSDCDYEKTLDDVMRSAFSNQGQICLCNSRLYIEEGIYHKFKNDLIERSNALKVGDPLLDNTDQGALVSKTHFNKILAYIEKAKNDGGHILCGGKRVGEKGFFISPTVIEGLKSSSICNQEEIFGPVVTIRSFKDEAKLLEMVNSTPYGLAGSIFTKDMDKADYLARNIHTGMLWVNTWMKRDLRIPFGGVKQSGLGREGGDYALSFFTQTKTVTR
jgi:aminomuconate-semialdehyde/2-hydroxymuconate-6-semialdehyde dehydrogenase